MSNLPKKIITDRQGNEVLPITHVSAVYDDSGTPVSTLIANVAEEASRNYVPTLDAAPTSSTTTYTRDGATKDFVLGQLCRVANAAGGYDFYQLTDLTLENSIPVATWQKRENASPVMEGYVPTLDAAPTSATVTYTKDGATKNFVVGQYCRVANGNDYDFYLLKDVTSGVALWDSIGSSSITRIKLNITAEEDGTVIALPSGAQGTVKYNGGTDQVLTNNTDFAEVPIGTAFTIEYADVDGFDTPGTYSGTANLDVIGAPTAIYDKLVAVDLGLPSGTLWAKGNIVSDGNGGYKMGKSTDYGAYVSWGNIDPHFSSNGAEMDGGYSFGTSNTISPYKDSPGASILYNYYDSIHGYVPDSGYDAAHELLGGTYRMPTYDDIKELFTICTKERTTINDVIGYKITSPINGKSIFLPCAGSVSETTIRNKGSRALYWTSSLYNLSSNGYYNYGQIISLQEDSVSYSDYTSRYSGLAVRAVQMPHYSINITLNPTDGSTVSGITVKVTDSEGVEHTGTTNEQGQATVQDVSIGDAAVSVPNYIKTKITVSSSTRVFTLDIAAFLTGVYIEATDGTLYNKDTWPSTGKTPNSIVLRTGNVSIKMAVNYATRKITANNSDAIQNYMTAKSNNEAKAWYDGAGDTEKIMQCNTYYGETDTSTYAAPYCLSYTFPDGTGNAYLPSVGEMYELWQNSEEVDACLAACNKSPMGSSTIWTSTMSSHENIPYHYLFSLSWEYGNLFNSISTDSRVIRPVAAY